ncbi:Protein of unknown function [Desulfonatronum thiosulfatophilum]|uniref:DUF1207 domain-containing protein n=1 Tax=Desulfonatronum thiosulfatophilum TaxID=617002 RepID=A0A1G6A1L7_9BACT|nr:DUF1207 domain-containing protein [Desulfonatronum thiosulfatophilum]SDB02322.1 Protein of unknown function [Desulfonatronum thiosulfatophilum]
MKRPFRTISMAVVIAMGMLLLASVHAISAADSGAYAEVRSTIHGNGYQSRVQELPDETFNISREGNSWDIQKVDGNRIGLFSVLEPDEVFPHDLAAGFGFESSFLSNTENFSQFERFFIHNPPFTNAYQSDPFKQRMKPSPEGIGSFISYDLFHGLRIFGGGGRWFQHEPTPVKPWFVRSGLEFEMPKAWLDVGLRPIGSINIRNFKDDEWYMDVSMRAGFQIENSLLLNHRLLFLIEYFFGRSPDGEFYIRDVESIGIRLNYFYD